MAESKGQSTTSNLSVGGGLLLRVLGRLVDRSSLNRFLNSLDMRDNRVVMRARPFDIQLETTTKCNLACIMCSRQKYHGAGTHLELPVLERVQAELVPYAQNLCISSFGEPLLYPDIRQLLEVARRFPRLELGMFTNLLLVDEDWARKLVDSRVAYLNVSIDGATCETYEKVRRGGKWKRLIEALQTLNRIKRERRSRRPILNLAVVGLTVNIHEMPLFIEFAKRYGFASLTVDPNAYIDDEEMECLSLVHAKQETNARFRAGCARALELGVHSNLDKVPFDLPERNSMQDAGKGQAEGPRGVVWTLRKARRALYLKWLRLGSIYHAAGKSCLLFPIMLVIKFYDRFLRRYFSPPRRYLHVVPNDAPPARCGNPWTHAHIKLDGKVYACCFNHTVMGDLTKQSFDDIWNGLRYRSLRHSIVTGNFWKSCQRAQCSWLEPGASEQYGARIEGVPEAMELLDGLGSRLRVKVTNTGKFAWPAAKEGDAGAPEQEFSLAYRLFQLDSRGRLQPVQECPHVGLPQAVSPGESIEMELPIWPIETPGEYMMKVDMVKEHVTWFGERGDSAVKISVRVKAFSEQYGARIEGVPEAMELLDGPGSRLRVKVTNTGCVIWPAARKGDAGEPEQEFSLAYQVFQQDSRGGLQPVQESPHVGLPHAVSPGESIEMELPIWPIQTPGEYMMKVDMVREHVTWFGKRSDSAIKLPVRVKAWRRGELRVHGLPEHLRAASEVAVEVVLTNTSETMWPAAGPYPVRLTYHWLTEQGEMAVHDGLRTSLGNDLAPGDSVALKARLLAPANPGVYRLQWDLVQEDVIWFGMDWPQTQVEVS